MHQNLAQGKDPNIKLLFITNDLGVGGVERLTVDFANHLDKNRFRVSIANLLDGPQSSFHVDQMDPDVQLHRFHFKRFWDFGGWFRLYRYIRQEKFDVVFTQLFMSDLFGRTAAYAARVPVIVYAIQNLIPSWPKKYIVTDRILRYITDVCISPTHTITVFAQEVIGFSADKIRVMPTNSVNLRRFTTPLDKATVRRSINVPEDCRMVITVGRLVEQKGHTVLLKAIPAILEEEPNTFFIFVGAGRLESDLKKEAADLGVSSHVRFLGARKDVPDLMRSADIFAFPSVFEGQGMSLFEAMFSDLAIVASRVGGIPDVIKHEETGLLCEPGNAGELARTLVRILRDDELRKRLATEVRQRYSDRTMDQAAKELGNLFIELLERKIGRSA